MTNENWTYGIEQFIKSKYENTTGRQKALKNLEKEIMCASTNNGDVDRNILENLFKTIKKKMSYLLWSDRKGDWNLKLEVKNFSTCSTSQFMTWWSRDKLTTQNFTDCEDIVSLSTTEF
jgi:hypothetical protein